MSVTLNGNTYDASDFYGSNGYGYASTFPATGLTLFPNSIFTDLLAELASADTVDSVSPGAAGAVLYSNGSAWIRSASPTLTSIATADGATMSATANTWAGSFFAASTASQSFGARIWGGTNSTDFAFGVWNAEGSAERLVVRGDGRISLSGNTIYGTDNTYDIGASGANRPRDLYLGRNLTVAGTGFFGTSLTLGSSSASSGTLRLPNAAAIIARNGADNGDISLLYLDASNMIQISASAATTVFGGVVTLAGGNLVFTDNTYDIGASGATRPRTGYFGTSVVTPVGTFATSVTAPTLTASTKVVATKYIPPSSTSIAFRDFADSNDNLALTDSGSLTVRARLTTGGIVNITGDTAGHLFLDSISDPGAPANGAIWFTGTALKIKLSSGIKTFTLA